MNGNTMDESTNIENQQNENEISSPMELSDTKSEEQKEQNFPTPDEKQQNENEISNHKELLDTKIEEHKEQNFPDPEIEENLKQHGCEDIPAIAALLLQNRIGDNSKLKESKEYPNKNNSDKNDNTIDKFPKVLSEATNGVPVDQDEEKETMKGSPLPDPELENSNSCQEKILNNSKDSSMLSTTDTQDEIETIDNGDQIFINHVDNQAEIAAQSNKAKQELLDTSIDSDDSLEEMLGSDLDPQTEETFSIVSGSEYDEASQGSIQEKHFENPIQDIDKPPENGKETPKLLDIEIEIEDTKKEKDNNESLTNDDSKIDKNKKNGNFEMPLLRRSSRTVKIRKYSYDEHNVGEDSEKEGYSEDTLKRKSRPIMINDTKSLVEIAARQAARSTATDRKEPQLVLIGSKPKQAASAPTPKNTSASINLSLYQSIVARGTTVTPVPSKPAPTTTTQAVQTSPTPTPVLLPYLTDDMFVVEAPSFIVPYVYEKPSIKPFKEFVDKLGKEIEVQRAKDKKEKMEKKKKRQKERQERIDKGEEVLEEDEKGGAEEKKSKVAKKERRRHGQEDDESSWDGMGWDSSDSEDFKITDDNGTTIVIDGKGENLLNTKKPDGVPASSLNSNSYFDGSLGKFFTNIGMGLVEEYVQRDLLKTQQRKLQREKKAGHSTKQRELEKSISLLTKNYEISKHNNKPLTCSQIKCVLCTFKTESQIVLAQHMLTPHMKNNMYKCNFCEFEIRSPHDILFHMETNHNVRGRLERAPAYHQCVNCPFEDNGKGKLARHIIACGKKFKPEHNLGPPSDWDPPAKIPKIAKARPTMLGAPIPPSGPFGRPQPSTNPFGRPPVTNMLPGTSSNYRPRARLPGPIMPRPVIAGGSIVRGSSFQQQATAAQAAAIAKKSNPSISITPVPPRSTLPVLPSHESATATFVICEICDGYIKDLEQLRNHMQWIHRVKIHPKMIYNRPPLNCQKCQFRFFTDMGLERHLLGSHGLVTSSMQEAANRNKDAGRCPACGKVFQWKLLNHMSNDHGMSLKPAHLSYKCTVCSSTFEMYKLFESHVYSAHSVVAKRVMDKVPVNKGKCNNIPKGLKFNDEITITAQPARSSKDK